MIIADSALDRYSLSEYSSPMNEFREWVEDRGQVEAGRQLGRTQGTISKWLATGEIPGEAVRHTSEITGIGRDKLNPRLFG